MKKKIIDYVTRECDLDMNSEYRDELAFMSNNSKYINIYKNINGEILKIMIENNDNKIMYYKLVATKNGYTIWKDIF